MFASRSVTLCLALAAGSQGFVRFGALPRTDGVEVVPAANVGVPVRSRDVTLYMTMDEGESPYCCTAVAMTTISCTSSSSNCFLAIANRCVS